jgi:hypothetical protein
VKGRYITFKAKLCFCEEKTILAQRAQEDAEKNRNLRRLVALTFAALFIGGRLLAQDTVKIQVNPHTVISHISPDFIGFGFETSAVAESNFFSGSNRVMIQLYRNLTTHGLMRIGGIISDHAKYAPEGTPASRTMKEVTVINRTNLADLADFARAVGWKVMWGLNLGTGIKEEAVQEARAVDAALGPALQSFQIGNEVEDLRRFKKSYDAYHAAYVDYKAAVRAALPNAPFSGPDSIGNLFWVTNFAAAEGRDIKLLTHHYYRGGASDPRTSLARLLQTDTNWDARLAKLQEICRDNGLAFRINEVNSFSGGGKPGVSDTFGSALWCLDYMFRAASYGCEGVNMETDVNQLGFISHYSPIVHRPDGQCSARPEYYGMLAFATAGKGDLLKLALDNTDINLSAYATRENDEALWITVVNKNFARDANVEIALPGNYSSARAFRLAAPSMESKERVTLAGSEVSTDGKWTPQLPEKLKMDEGRTRLTVPHASAVLVLMNGQN